jgi:hypothetical protein
MIFVEEAGTDTRRDWTVARLIVLIVPIAAAATLLRLWLSPPLAWGISTLGWTLLAYWFPSKPRVTYVKWIFLSLLFAIATSLLAAVL